MSDDIRTALFVVGAGMALLTFLFHTRRTTRRGRRDDLLNLRAGL